MRSLSLLGGHRPGRLALCTCFAVIGIATWLAGCQTLPAGTGGGTRVAQPAPPPPTKDLTLGLVYSQWTKRAIAYGKQQDARHMRSGFPPIAVEDSIQDIVEMLEARFASVVPLKRASSAGKAGIDLLATLDVQVFFPAMMMSQDTARFLAKLRFTTPKGRRIDVIGGDNTVYAPGVRPAGPGMFDTEMRAYKRVVSAAMGNIRSGLSGSAKLAQFSAAGGSPRKVVRRSRTKRVRSAPKKPVRKNVYRSDVDTPVYRYKQRPSNFALVIGVEEYDGLPDADFAERDAEAVRKHLIALGYPKRNILYLTGKQALKSSIEKYVEAWLPRNVKPASRVFVYFSGHGSPSVRSGDAYLVPWDGDLKFIENTGYPVKRLYERLGALRAKQVVVALDACFSGAGGRSVIAKGTRPLVMKVDTGLASMRKLVVLSASAADEVTGAKDDQGHGLFTYYFLKGLNGGASKPGRATVRGLYNFILPKVQEEARRDNRDQTPQLMPPKVGRRANVRLR